MWNTLSKDVQDIVWYFCGDLRDARNRYHKFVGLELKVWQMLLGAPIQPRKNPTSCHSASNPRQPGITGSFSK